MAPRNATARLYRSFGDSRGVRGRVKFVTFKDTKKKGYSLKCDGCGQTLKLASRPVGMEDLPPGVAMRRWAGWTLEDNRDFCQRCRPDMTEYRRMPLSPPG